MDETIQLWSTSSPITEFVHGRQGLLVEKVEFILEFEKEAPIVNPARIERLLNGVLGALTHTRERASIDTVEIDIEITASMSDRELERAFELAIMRALERVDFGEDISEPARAITRSNPVPERLPENLVLGVEELAGLDLSSVRVYRNSPMPPLFGAAAFAKGTAIYLSPGTEHLLPHEAWHVVQQAQGRVRGQVSAMGEQFNVDPLLEREADRMGARALLAASRALDRSQRIVDDPSLTTRTYMSSAPSSASPENVVQLARTKQGAQKQRGAPRKLTGRLEETKDKVKDGGISKPTAERIRRDERGQELRTNLLRNANEGRPKPLPKAMPKEQLRKPKPPPKSAKTPSKPFPKLDVTDQRKKRKIPTPKSSPRSKASPPKKAKGDTANAKPTPTSKVPKQLGLRSGLTIQNPAYGNKIFQGHIKSIYSSHEGVSEFLLDSPKLHPVKVPLLNDKEESSGDEGSSSESEISVKSTSLKGKKKQTPVRSKQVKKKKPTLAVPPVFRSELSPMSQQVMSGVDSLEEFEEFRKKFMPVKDGEPEEMDHVLYISTLIQNREHLKEEDKQKADLLYRIFTPKSKREGDKPKVDHSARFKKAKKGVVESNMGQIKDVLVHLKKEDEDFGSKQNLVKQTKALGKELEEHPEGTMALSDYANTLYSQFRDTIEQPWLNEFPKGMTKDTPLQRLVAVHDAQEVMENLSPEMFGVDKAVYRWVKGLESVSKGDVISPLALWSASAGPVSSQVFAPSGGDRTLYVIRPPHSGKLIQLLTGTKNWYQREVLFPAYCQFVVAAKKETDHKSWKEIWYVIDELAETPEPVPEGAKEIGLPVGKEGYKVTDDELYKTLVDRVHRDVVKDISEHEYSEKQWKSKLKKSGIEIEKLKDFDLDNPYGELTHSSWKKALLDSPARLELLTLESFRQYHTTLFGKKMEFRDEEVGWGETVKLETKEIEAIRNHQMLVYPVIRHEDIDRFVVWLRKGKAKVEKTDGSKVTRAEYIQWVQNRQQEEDKPDIEVLDHQYAGFVRSLKSTETLFGRYQGTESLYSVSHGVPGKNQIETGIKELLNRTSVALEQALSLYVKGVLDGDDYQETIQRNAAMLQQKVVAIHPFMDANGRLSRLMMYKVLQVYSRSDEEIDLPVIDDPGGDLKTSYEDWYEKVFKK